MENCGGEAMLLEVGDALHVASQLQTHDEKQENENLSKTLPLSKLR